MRIRMNMVIEHHLCPSIHSLVPSSVRSYYCGSNLVFPTISHPKQQHNLGYIHDPGAGYHYAFRVPSESKKTIINAPPKENMIENA